MTSAHGLFFAATERSWINLRVFCYRNHTIVEMFFILLYSLEQVGLVWFIYHLSDSGQLGFVVSLFVVIVLTTFGLHKLAIESRTNMLQRGLQEQLDEKMVMEAKTRQIIEKYDELADAYNKLLTKSLNSTKKDLAGRRGSK